MSYKAVVHTREYDFSNNEVTKVITLTSSHPLTLVAPMHEDRYGVSVSTGGDKGTIIATFSSYSYAYIETDDISVAVETRVTVRPEDGDEK